MYECMYIYIYIYIYVHIAPQFKGNEGGRPKEGGLNIGQQEGLKM